MANTVTNPGARLAGLFADLGHKLKAGNISEDELALFLKRQNPFRDVLASASAATFVTADYFVTRPGLWMSDDFTSRITAAYPKALVPCGLNSIKSFDLEKESHDHEIIARSEMSGKENLRKHAFTPDQIATLIDIQSNGVTGKLLNNGQANLFYLVGANDGLFVVFIRWSSRRSRWYVSAWELGQNWIAGDRVFHNTQV